MKIRHGFVSNSSSSSFVVKIREDIFDVLQRTSKDRVAGKKFSRKPLKLITDKQMKVLKKLGFRNCALINASDLEAGVKPEKGKGYMYASVIVNQHEIVESLVKARIPFTGACHYGHETIIYEGGNKPVWTIPNIGLQREMYGMDDDTLETQTGVMSKQTPEEIDKEGWHG